MYSYFLQVYFFIVLYMLCLQPEQFTEFTL